MVLNPDPRLLHLEQVVFASLPKCFQWSLALPVYSLGNICFLCDGWIQWLASNKENTGKGGGSHFPGQVKWNWLLSFLHSLLLYPHTHSFAVLPCSLSWTKFPNWRHLCSKELRVVPGQYQGRNCSLGPTAHEELDPAPNWWMSLKVDPALTQPWW